MSFKSSFTTLAVAAISFCLIGGTTPAYADLGDQLFKLLADDGAADDYFGISVAISGTIAIVGAYNDDDNGPNSGSAYVFDTFTGQQIRKLLPDDGNLFDRFGISVAISGDTAIVGTWGDDNNGENSGSAYLFDIPTGQQIAKFLADDGAAHDRFGFSVAINGTSGNETAIVGAHGDDDNGSWSGSAYLFDISDPMNPMQSAKLLPGDGAAGDFFGWSVAIGGNPGTETAVAGANLDNDNGAWSGSAYLFDAAGTPGKCPWDLHGDGLVGPGDLLILLGWWGFDPGGPPDFDGDGNVGASDLLALLANWGPCP